MAPFTLVTPVVLVTLVIAVALVTLVAPVTLVTPVTLVSLLTPVAILTPVTHVAPVTLVRLVTLVTHVVLKRFVRTVNIFHPSHSPASPIERDDYKYITSLVSGINTHHSSLITLLSSLVSHHWSLITGLSLLVTHPSSSEVIEHGELSVRDSLDGGPVGLGVVVEVLGVALEPHLVEVVRRRTDLLNVTRFTN